MDKDDFMDKLKGYLAEKNYVAACLYLKDEEIPDHRKYEITGEVAAQVIDDLAAEKNREKILYLRSILVWLFKEVPGLASVYREQLRLASSGQGMMREFLQGARTFADAATGGASESVQEKFEEATDNLRPEVIEEKVRDFFSQAGVDIDDGIKRAQQFFDGLAGRREEASSGNPRDAADADDD